MKFLLPLLLLPTIVSAVAQDAKPAPTATATGLVFRVEGGKAPLYLCGSVHLLTKQDYPLPKGYEAAFDGSARIVFEVPPADLNPAAASTAVAKYGILKEGTLDALLTDEARTTLTIWAGENQLPLESLAHLQPWLVALLISQKSYEAVGMKAEYGLDKHFVDRLAKDGKSSVGLETIDEQMKLLGGFDLKTQISMIVQSIEEAKAAEQELAKLLKAWRNGNTGQLETILTEAFKDFPEVEKVLLHDRNARWLPKLQAMLAEDQPTMVVVGAGHLCGPKGVCALLAQAGYTVTQLK